ncbi:MAG: efflux RND transporter permease subunit [Deltaproteobacteria bacterium]|nr:efflux RND transporter permease subunit [Deltaproteobacteria bacterium]
MGGVLAVFVRRPVFTWVLVLSILVTGIASLRGLPLARYPNVDIPAVTITTVAQGLSARQIETEVTARVEAALGSISGLERVDSVSQEGLSSVVAQFVLSKEGSVAAQDVRERLARLAAELPPTARSPQVELFDANAAPVMLVALTAGGRTETELAEIADGVVRRELTKVSGVGDVRLSGARRRAFTIELDPTRLSALDVTAVEVQSALAREDLDAPGGEVANGPRALAVRVAARARSPAELADVVVARRGTMAVRLRDLGRIGSGPEAPTSFAYVSGEQAVVLAVVKQSGANTLAVLTDVRERLEELRASRLPAGVGIRIVRDEGVFVKASLDAVEEHLVLGALFAALTVFVFLRNLRATLISALAIPASIVGTFAAVRALGLSLNMLSLLGLTLAVGIVIDDAVVVLENVVRVMRVKRLPPAEAAVAATREIALAVLATTLSLVAVFLPIGFMGGIVGRFLASFGLTMAVSILLSMVIAFTLTPMLCGRWLRSPPPRAAAGHDRDHEDGWLERVYGRVVAFVLRKRWVVGVAMAAALGAIVPVGIALPKTFLPVEDEARFELYVKLPTGAVAPETARVAEALARDLRAFPEVADTVVLAGAPRGDASGRGANEATVYVSLRRYGVQAKTMDRVRREVVPRAPPGSLVLVNVVSDFAGAGPEATSVQFLLRGSDLRVLEDRAGKLLEAARRIPGTTDHGITLSPGAPELVVALDRARASELGVSQADVADALRFLGRAGIELGTMRDPLDAFETSYPVRISVAGGLDAPANRARALTLRGAGGRAVTLAELGAVEPSVGPSSIRRTNRERQVTLFMNTSEGTSDQAVVDALVQASKTLALPPGTTTDVVGNAKEMEKASEAFQVAIVLSFVFMYLVLAAQFESWIHPITILVSLPLTVPFALLSLLVFGQSLNLFSALGFLVLFGIVKKNAILQVDHTLALRRAGMARDEAVIRANQDRLRPILMTTVAFVAGLAPLVIATGAGAGTNRAIGVGVMGGQALALFLTLVATPVVYTWLDDLRAAVARRTSALRASAAAPSAAPPA